MVQAHCKNPAESTSCPIDRAVSSIPYLLSLSLPVSTLYFFWVGASGVIPAIPAFAVVTILLLLDGRAPSKRTAAAPAAAGIRLILFAAVVLQLMNLFLFLRVAVVGASVVGMVIGVFLMGATTAWSGVVVAHEFIHGRSKGLRFLGRILLWSSLYDRFYIDHIRGHHVHG